jgi:prepilin-type N-terminal cleavage/methylation domain-containing protein
MKGFTLVEVLVVAAITVMITGFLIANFSRSRVDLNQITLTTLDAVREAQSQALSGAVLRGTYRCGYGIHFDENGYLLYAGADSSKVDCSSEKKSFGGGKDAIVRQALLPNNTLEFILPIPDIFFEPPNPTTYIGESSTAGLSTTISIRRKGAKCPSADCRTIYVSTSGRIQTQ